MAITAGIKGLSLAKGRYIVDRVVCGSRIFHRFELGTDLRTAELWISKKISEAISGRYLPESKTRSLTVRDLLNAYWNEHLFSTSQEYKESRKFHFDRIDSFFGCLIIPAFPPIHGQVMAGILTAGDVERYIHQRSKEKKKNGWFISPSTIQDEINVLAQAIHHCMKRSLSLRISYDPIAGYSRPKQKDPDKIVIDEGTNDGPVWRAIYSKCSVLAQPLVLCLYETGMRPKEVFFLRRSWFVECAPDRWIIEFPSDFQEKTSKERRRVPISLRLLESIKPILQSLEPNDLIFPSPRTKKERTRHWGAFGRAVKRVSKMAFDASKFSDYTEFAIWTDRQKWKKEDVLIAWEVRGFNGYGVTPYALASNTIVDLGRNRRKLFAFCCWSRIKKRLPQF